MSENWHSPASPVMPGIRSLDCLDKVFRRAASLVFVSGHLASMLALVVWTETFLTCMHAKVVCWLCLPCSCCHCSKQTCLSPFFCVQLLIGQGCCTGDVRAKALARSWIRRAPLERPLGGRLGCPCTSDHIWRDFYRQAFSQGLRNLLKHALLEMTNTPSRPSLSTACLPVSGLLTCPFALQRGLPTLGTGVGSVQRPGPVAKARRTTLAQAGKLVQR